MSGYKRATIQVNEEEYRRLHEADQRLRSLEKNLQKQLERESKENRAVLRSQVKMFEARQENFRTLISGFSEHVQYIEQATQMALFEQEASLYAALEENQGTLWEEVNELLNQQSQYFENMIIEESYQWKRENQDLFEAVNSLYDDQARKQHLAKSWLEAAQDLFDFLHQYYDCEKFAPGLLDHYRTRLWQAADNLENGVPEGTILDAQQMVSEISQNRIDLERQERAWWLVYQSVLEWTAWLRELVKDNLICEALDLDGQPLGIPIEVDFWTSGLMSRIDAYLEQVIYQLETQADQLNEDALRQYLDIELPQVEEAVNELVYRARLQTLNSQLRINIADIVLLALEEQGFAIDQAGYTDGDMRKDFCASAVNRQGSEIVIDVVPTGDEYGMNELHLLSKDAEVRTEHELHQRTKEISQTLQRYGLLVGPLNQTAVPISTAGVPGQNVRARRSAPASTSG
jgi:hypothetical protein